MKYVGKCVLIFIALTALFIIGESLLFDTPLPLSGGILLYGFISLMLTIFYGWIDAVYIKKRFPDME